MTEQNTLEILSQYRQMKARLQVLSTYSVGAGITVSRLNEEDQLQELHQRLRGLPSYLYLNKHEQKLETIAHAYLRRYPVGTQAQLAAVPKQGADPEDDILLRELRDKIKKIIEARGWEMRSDIDEVLERLAEYQDLKAGLSQVDAVLSALEDYKPTYAKLLRYRYVDGMSPADVAAELNIAERTYRVWKTRAEREFNRISS
ncbi:sigma factor-like helix-turn-helix DNA-binding protein [Paenibacillus alkalitolerans]|uniref:sigma factor-like helix-turn-helix DNA-binding protein n=1 Tax=Paenibacillus alkalitolerans TaxID=2799335 RepID=UPI002D7F9400|nr:sigma factor-like helix-turn-helix DNA-binding protein [Paenibacillus alkalitolerans]